MKKNQEKEISILEEITRNKEKEIYDIRRPNEKYDQESLIRFNLVFLGTNANKY